MSWTMHARVGGEPTALACTTDAPPTRTAAEAWIPSDDAIAWTHPGPRGARLEFARHGEGPTYDLLVRSGERSLLVTNLHVTGETAAWLEPMDAVCVLTGDDGYEKTERIVVLGLGPIREALQSGDSSVNGDHLDHARVLGSTHGLDLAADRLLLDPADGSTDLAVAWGIPRSNPPESRLVMVSFPQWIEGVALSRAQVVSSNTVELRNLWVSRVVSRTDEGVHTIDVVGTTRRRNDFCVSVQRVRSDVPLPMAQALGSAPTPDEHALTDAALRNAGSLQTVFPLAGADAALGTLETPTRERRMVRIDLAREDISFEVLDASPVPYPKVLEPATDALESQVEDSAVDDDGLRLVPGRVATVELGEQSTTPRPVVVVVDGDAAAARLVSWLGRSDDQWTLYIEAQTDVSVEVQHES